MTLITDCSYLIVYLDRLRLREEVDILKHLSRTAFDCGANGRHPNVLAYIDSWDEEDFLYIQTELCESGNLARFLWEYGRVFPRLDEARIWKIIADLSNVSLQFIKNGILGKCTCLRRACDLSMMRE